MSASFALRLTWVSWLTLFLQQAADAWAYQAPWFIWTLKLLPLLIFLPGMLKDNLRSYILAVFRLPRVFHDTGAAYFRAAG